MRNILCQWDIEESIGPLSRLTGLVNRPVGRIASAILIALMVLTVPRMELLAQSSAVRASLVWEQNASDKNGEIRFGAISSGVVFRDGRVVIADASDLVLRVLNADGTQRFVFGNRGRGPGEFTQLSWVGNCTGDSIYVWDGSAAKFLTFSSEGGFVRETLVPESRSATAVSCSRTGTLISATSAVPSPVQPNKVTGTTSKGVPYEVVQLQARIRVIQPDGRRVESATFTARESFLARVLPDGKVNNFPMPLGASHYVAMAGSSILLATTDSNALRLLDTNGVVVSRRLLRSSRAATPDDFEREIQHWLDRIPKSISTYYQDFARTLPPPSRMPAILGATADNERGVAWITLSTGATNETAVVAIDSAGREVRRISLPRAGRVLSVNGDWLLLRSAGEDGEETIGLYRLTSTK